MKRLIVGATLLMCSTLTAAAEWPEKPIRFIMPYGAGSGPDSAVRPFVDSLSKVLGQSVVVENFSGAGGIIGANTLARAKPDGYTFGFGNNIILAVNRSFFDELPYDPDADFAPVGLLFDNAYVLVTRPDFPANSVAELISYAQENPGEVDYASGTGIGSGSHLTGEMLRSRTDIDIVHVPYKTGSQALSDLVSGRVDIMFDNISGVQQFVRDGKLKALAVTSGERLKDYPEIPTMAESGLENFEAVAWGGVLAPAGTPDDIIQEMNSAIAEAMEAPAVVRSNQTMSLTPLVASPEVFAEYIQSEAEKWAEMVELSGAKADAR